MVLPKQYLEKASVGGVICFFLGGACAHFVNVTTQNCAESTTVVNSDSRDIVIHFVANYKDYFDLAKARAG